MNVTTGLIQRKAEPYETKEGFQPFSDWLDSVRDVVTKGRNDAKIRKMEQGGFGDYRHLSEGVFEARLNFGPGWRLYFGLTPKKIVLLWGGTKKRQTADMVKARRFWAEYERIQGERSEKEKT